MWREATRWTYGPRHSSCYLEYKPPLTIEGCGKLTGEEKEVSMAYLVMKTILYSEGDILCEPVKAFKSLEKANRFIEEKADELYSSLLKEGENVRLIKTEGAIAVEAMGDKISFEVEQIDFEE